MGQNEGPFGSYKPGVVFIFWFVGFRSLAAFSKKEVREQNLRNRVFFRRSEWVE
jgi:hypothetical protein